LLGAVRCAHYALSLAIRTFFGLGVAVITGLSGDDYAISTD
jgi:hypothetical protein